MSKLPPEYPSIPEALERLEALALDMGAQVHRKAIVVLREALACPECAGDPDDVSAEDFG